MVAGRRSSEGRIAFQSLVAGAILVIDESLNPRIAAEVRARGRDAISVQQLRLKGKKDPALLTQIYRLHPTCVLVTADEAMPIEHPEQIKLAMATLAIISGRRPSEYAKDQESWEREIVQRWAHKMPHQAPQTILRYGASGSRAWTARR